MSDLPFRRRPGSRRVIAVLAVLSIICPLVWLAFWGGSLYHWFQPAPQLDSSTPRVQGGYTLAEAHVEGSANPTVAAFVLIQPPSLPDCQSENEEDGYTLYALPGGSPGPYNRFTTPPTAPIIQATAQTSEGDVLPLTWWIVGDTHAPKYLRVDIPGGYSNACRFMDITLVTRTGAFPKWRIMRLPSMRRNIPDAPTVQTMQNVKGIPVSARAWRIHKEAFLQLLPILPPASHQWEIASADARSEFEKFGQAHAPDPDPVFYRPIEGRSGQFTPNDTGSGSKWFGSLITRFPADYRSSSRYVRLDCDLVQFETLEERVTFPNVSIRPYTYSNGTGEAKMPNVDQAYYLSVPKPITLTTASGVSVTLPVQGKSETGVADGRINVYLSVKRSYSTGELPNSPLTRQFGKPVTIGLDFTPPNYAGGWAIGPDDTNDYELQRDQNPNWSFKLPREQMQKIPLYLAPPSRRNLTVIVRQRAELQRLPLSFTVPVADKTPPDIHWQ